ncbi:MAG: hypothetical protein K8U57_35845 [Planctomycetes bacterium]|nr:hypothetical protein [Planctomycetota bacterium]
MNHLTGKTRVRIGWRGRLILQVQETYQYSTGGDSLLRPHTGYRWRDAKVTDLPVFRENGGMVRELENVEPFEGR